MVKGTIYVGNPAYLSLKNAQMILRKPDDSAEEVALSSAKVQI